MTGCYEFLPLARLGLGACQSTAGQQEKETKHLLWCSLTVGGGEDGWKEVKLEDSFAENICALYNKQKRA